MPKYPDIEVDIDDGNAFLILGRVRKALRRAQVPQEEIEKFTEEAKSGDYDHLLQICEEWVEII